MENASSATTKCFTLLIRAIGDHEGRRFIIFSSRRRGLLCLFALSSTSVLFCRLLYWDLFQLRILSLKA
ncbi:unnamed protein product [Toxocara canis]|uniref:Uncharacterized protein n=1 Tax=Toxocara canis TaxID=6265 RepID=A0A3P7GU93_TOXCA|nr:unnamed protein product [Toxocara canis]